MGNLGDNLVIDDEFKRFPFHVSLLAETLKTICTYDYDLGIKRRENFWTVGMASYLDKDKYTEQEFAIVSAKYNKQLQELFREMYEFQILFFEMLLKEPVKYMPNMPLPGFHVFKYCEDFEKPLARPHVDIPFNKFSWGDVNSYNDIFTHVIAVEVPDNSGMNVWDITSEDIHNYGYNNLIHLLPETELAGMIPHIKDTLVMHSGRFLHQIKPFDKGNGTSKTVWRITLQSHAIRIDNAWYLYW